MKYLFRTVAIMAIMAGSASAQTWGNIATVGTQTTNDLCYTDGTDIICDGDLSVNGAVALDVSGTVSATAFVGDGSGLTNISVGALTIGIDDLTDAIHDTDDYSSLFLGNGAGANDDGTDNNNVGIGKNALSTATTGNVNVAVGSYSLENNLTGFANIGIGYYSAQRNTTGFVNTAIGGNTLQFNETGDANVALGTGAGTGSSGASNINFNVFLGRNAGNAVLTGADDNVFIGYQAGDDVTTGARNILIGKDAETQGGVTSSDELNIGNTIYGDLANDMVSIGITVPTEELEVSGTVSATAFVGDGSGLTGVAAGSADWYDITSMPTGVSDISDTALTTAELGELQNIDATTISATQWGYLGASDQGIATTDAVQFADVSVTSAFTVGTTVAPTTAVEVSGTVSATEFIGDGSQLTNISVGALTVGINDLTDGAHDTDDYSSLFLGNGAGANDDGTDNQNVGIGKDALAPLTTGAYNVGVGYQTLQNSSATGTFNVAVGTRSMVNATSNENVAVGTYSLQNGGYSNAVLGYQALQTTTGSENIAIGHRAGLNQTSGNTNIVIGYDQDLANLTGSNQLNIGGAIYGDLANDQIAIGLTDPNAELDVSGTVSATAFVGDGSGLTGIGSVNSIDDLSDGIHDTDDYSSLFLGNGAGANDDGASNNNLGIGVNALNAVTTGTNNVAIGANALDANSTSSNNAAFGVNALGSSTGGESNTAIGFLSSADNVTGDNNVSVGAYASKEGLGNDYTAIGDGSLRYVTGSRNTALGSSAGAGSTGASSVARNVFAGYQSGLAVLTGADDNTFLGYQSGLTVTTGARNILIGGGVDTVGGVTSSDELNIGNTIYGDLANDMISIGITVPTEELEVSGTVSATAFVGDGSGLTGIGSVNSIDDLSDGIHDTDDYSSLFLGNGAGANDDGTTNDNVGVGLNTLNAATTASSNVAIGANALATTTTEGANVAIGKNALTLTTVGENTAVGAFALQSNSTGLGNTAMGRVVMANNTTGAQNVAVGNEALYSNIGGGSNVAVGHNALYFNETGSDNIVLGRFAGRGATGASNVSRNIFMGYEAGNDVLTGANDNVFVGYQAGDLVTTGADNILIGSGVDTIGGITASNELNIGNTIYGDLANDTVGIGKAAPTTNALDVSGSVKIADTTTETCAVAGDLGQMRFNTTTLKFQFCRDY